MKTIAILAAKREEFKGAKEAMRFNRCLGECGGFFSRGNYKNFKILFLETGIGERHIEERISKLLKNQNVDFAICTGFLGALEKEMKVGDIVIPSKLASISEE